MVVRRIKQLSQRLANQIAAGEVVERPASVMKELLENSIDADATAIEIDVEQGGKQLIKLRDNGCGMHKDDLPLALASHATSKIYTLDELNAIQSLGFRGEALASISAISRFSLISRQQDAAAAWQVKVEGRDMQAKLTPASHPVGTTVSVQDIFFNTPARRKFLRTDKTELQHIEETLRRIALANYSVQFVLRHNNKEVLRLPSITDRTQQGPRIGKIFGNNFLAHALRLDTEVASLRLWGFLSEPDFTRSQNDLQYFYVNGRMVRDKLINHAVKQAYSDLLYPGRQPLFLLYLEIDPSTVDVNVHPTKHEVRFREARLIHDFIVKSIVDVLQQPAAQQAEAETVATATIQTAPNTLAIAETAQTYEASQTATTEHNYATDKIASTTNATPVASDITIARTTATTPGRAKMPLFPEPVAQVMPSMSTPVQSLSPEHKTMATQTLATQKNYHEMRLIGLFASKYFIIEQQQTLCILDYQQAKQAQLRQQFLQAKQRQQLQQKPLLVPVTIKLDKAQSTVQEKLCALLAEFAFSIEAFGAETIIVRSIPALLIATSIAQLMQVVMTALLQASQPLSTDAILALIAQHGFSPEPLTQQNIADHFAELTTALSRTELDRFSMHITLDTLNKAIPA